MRTNIIRANALQQLPEGFDRLSGTAKVNAILDLDSPERFVQRLAPDSLYFLMRDIGVGDCLDLLPMTTTEQRRAFIDLDAWRGSEFDPIELDSWLSTLSAAGGEQLVIDTVASLDPELLVDYLLNYAVIVLDRTEEDEIEAYEQHYVHLRTPDQDFVIVLPPTEDDEVSRVQRMVEALYRGGLKRARDLMFACKTGLRLENEELAYRFRVGRMADLGFPSREDSWSLFAPVDIESVRASLAAEAAPSRAPFPEDESHLGLIMGRSLSKDSFLTRCLEGVEDTERFVREYAALVNRAVVAEPGELVLRDVDRLSKIASIARATASLGLEILCNGSVELGKQALNTVWLIQLHQIGHRATVERALKAKRLQEYGGPLFPTAIQAALDHLRWVPRPQYTDELLDPRAFATTDDLAACDALLERAEQMATSFDTHFGITGARFAEQEFDGLSEDDRAYITYDSLANTLVAHCVLSGSPALSPLSTAQIMSLAASSENFETLVSKLSKQIPGAEGLVLEAARSLTTALAAVRDESDVNQLRTTLLISTHRD